MITLSDFLYTKVIMEGYSLVWGKTDFKNFNVPKNPTEDKYVGMVFTMAEISAKDKNYDEFKKLVKNAFQKWKNDFNFNKLAVPFRGHTDNPKKMKLCRQYDGLLGGNRKTYGDIHVEMGNGLGGGKGGYKFEEDAVGAFCIYMVNGCSLEGLKENWNLAGNLISMLEAVDKSKLKDELNAAYEYYLSNNSQFFKSGDIKKLVKTMESVIYQTGESKNKRGIDNIFADEDGDGIRESSGEIISDIDLKVDNKRTVHISMKDTKAQLSGVIVSPSKSKVFKDAEKWMEVVLNNTVDYDNITNKEHKQAFENFWTMLGVDPKSVYDAWQERKKRGHVNDNQYKIEPTILLTGSFNGTRCGEIIQNIIGGNYWYVSPVKCLFIPSQSQQWKFTPTHVHMTGRGVCIEGKLKDVSMKIWVRSSSSKATVPNRMFPVVTVDELFGKIGEEK